MEISKFDDEYDLYRNGTEEDKKIIKHWREESKKNFMDDILKFHPEANKTVLQFIADFLYLHTMNPMQVELLRKQFHAGYCYYFAVMLKRAFERGTICVCGNIGHFVWVDTDGTPYDIEGVNETECDCYIPESYVGEAVNDFLHVEGKDFNATKEYVDDMVAQYKACTQNIAETNRLGVNLHHPGINLYNVAVQTATYEDFLEKLHHIMIDILSHQKQHDKPIGFNRLYKCCEYLKKQNNMTDNDKIGKNIVNQLQITCDAYNITNSTCHTLYVAPYYETFGCNAEVSKRFN